MSKRPITSKIEPIGFAHGVTKTRNLPLNVYRELSCYLKLNCTFGAGSTFNIEEMIKLIPNIDLTINGQNTIFKNPLAYWYLTNYIKNQGVLAYSIDASAGTRDVWLQFEIPFTVLHGYAPEDCLLDLRNASTAVMKVDFASSTVANTTINSGNLFINSDEHLINDADVIKTSEVSFMQQSFTKSGKTRIELPVGFDCNYYRLILEVFNSSNIRSDAELSEVSLQSGNNVIFIKEAHRIKQDNCVKYKIPYANCITGLYIIDLTREGKLTQVVETGGLSEFVINADVANSGGFMRIYAEKITNTMPNKLGLASQEPALKAK